ncbi:alpha/beta hydrolase [Aspergillus saccharolyticus JOP 1030-1]|uniref:Putative hydrolase of the alpha/beta superfamily n=1 Tax=Aspergillus saccharolyticus JOP 1030-1 TaxID=1450539 RepID=A0A319A6Y3_9EURO|nr:putative hydrolase of the alpha/beta superfamily [Aspergillus saccharolyticus JOP 1030-1]PYH43072.1 putative hydrolase of the alpha/beta superfamily [Aspergillus saccharolyticus JOP 1030-1]
MANESTPITLPNSSQFDLENSHGQKYLIQLSWPLHWQDGHPTSPLPIIYIVDGNALFLTATETAWRRAVSSRFAGGGLIVAIGYPQTDNLFNFQRRNLDLTPPSEHPVPGHGGADEFLAFITDIVRPAVKARFPHLTCSREALYGHSYGGLLALHALFTRSDSFDCYIASSPSIWWNGRCILEEARSFLGRQRASGRDRLPSLMAFVGSFEQNPPQWSDETQEQYKERKRIAADLRMGDDVLELCDLLRDSPHLQSVYVQEYEGEEHTSVMACSMSRGLTMFFEDGH